MSDESAVDRLRAERDEAREVVARCNNSFGSYGYFTNPHPANKIEELKFESGERWRKSEALRLAIHPFACLADLIPEATRPEETVTLEIKAGDLMLARAAYLEGM